VTLLSLVAVAETWIVARVGFGADIDIHHPAALVATLAVTTLAMAGTALVMAGLFVLARTARTFQNTLNYPVFLLAGVIVPITYLPEWLRPLGRLLFLTWSAELLRESLSPEPLRDLTPRLGVILFLGAAGFALGRATLYVVLRRVRGLGTLGFE